MKIENSNPQTSFKARYFVTGKIRSQGEDVAQMVSVAKRQAAEVWEAVENHCSSNKIPFFVDSCDIKPHLGRKIHEDVISFSFLTGRDASDYTANAHSGRFTPASTVNKGRYSFLDASEVLFAIKNNTFDFINGIINNHNAQEKSLNLIS